MGSPPFLLLLLLSSPLSVRADDSADLKARLEPLAASFEARLQTDGYVSAQTPPAIVVDSSPQLSYFVAQENAVHTSMWRAVPPEWQLTFSRWASLAEDGITGEQLFSAMFGRFFFVHEMAHWAQSQYGPTLTSPNVNVYEYELEANRLSVAYWRAQDPAFLATLVREFRTIERKLPDPMPRGQDRKQYFTKNHRNLAENPDAYGWFQFDTALLAYDESPSPTMKELIHRLPHLTY